MKKELLIASALVSTLGAASVANAVTATMSGSHHTGLRGVLILMLVQQRLSHKLLLLASQFLFQRLLMAV